MLFLRQAMGKLLKYNQKLDYSFIEFRGAYGSVAKVKAKVIHIYS